MNAAGQATLHAACLFICAALALTACSSAVTPDRLAKITTGMKTDDVVAQLGQPARIDHAEITGLTGDAYHYVSAQGDAKVVFINGAVFATQFVPGGQGS
jgi:hypothetical protein